MNNEHQSVTPVAEDERVIDLREVFSLVLSKALWIILCMAIFAMGAALYTKYFVKPRYTSTATIYVKDQKMLNTSNLVMATYLAEDYVKTVTLRTVLEETLENRSVNMSIGQLQGSISISLDEESRYVYIAVTAGNASLAQALCEELCLVSKARFESVTELERISIMDEANLPAAPHSSGMMKNVIIGALLGAVLPCLLILFIYVIDDRVKTADDVQRALKLSTLGTIPYVKIPGGGVADE